MPKGKRSPPSRPETRTLHGLKKYANARTGFRQDAVQAVRIAGHDVLFCQVRTGGSAYGMIFGQAVGPRDRASDSVDVRRLSPKVRAKARKSLAARLKGPIYDWM